MSALTGLAQPKSRPPDRKSNRFRPFFVLSVFSVTLWQKRGEIAKRTQFDRSAVRNIGFAAMLERVGLPSVVPPGGTEGVKPSLPRRNLVKAGQGESS